MANRRRQKKNRSKGKKNVIQNKNNSDVRDEPKRGNKVLPIERPDFKVESMKGAKSETSAISDTHSIITQIENGFFGRKVEAIPIKENKCLITQESRIDDRSWKENGNSRNRLEKLGIMSNAITKRYRKLNKVRSFIMLNNFKKFVKMEEFFSFNKMNNELLKCFSYQSITVRKLSLNETLRKSIKNPLSNVIFESIIKKDGFTLLNKEMGLTYRITLKNANPGSLSQENIYFTLNCIECKDSTFICQSLDSLFSFKASKQNRLCETYKNQQNYLSLIYNGCFFPTLVVKNCSKCSVNVDDNLKDSLNDSLLERNEKIRQTTSFSQINTSIKARDFNSLTAEKGFIPQKPLNNCYSKHSENKNDRLHEQNAFEGNFEKANTFSSFESSNLSSTNSFKCYSSIICDCNSVCNSYIGESIPISSPYGVSPNYAHYLNEPYNSVRYINYNTTVPVVDNENLSEGIYRDAFQSAELAPSVAELGSLSSSCSCACFPAIKTESNSISNNSVSDKSLYYNTNSNYIGAIYSPVVHNPLKTEWTNSKELDNSYESNTYSYINETAKKDIFVENIKQEPNSSYQSFEDSLVNPEYTDQNQIPNLLSYNPATSYVNLCPYSNQMFTEVANQNSCLCCTDYESKLQNLNCSQCFIPSNNNSSCNIGFISNKFVPISYSDVRETTVPEIKEQNDMNFSYLHDYNEIDYENRKSVISDSSYLLEEIEKPDGVNSNGKYRIYNDKHSNTSEFGREYQLIPEFGALQAVESKYMDSYMPSYTDINSVSEYELPKNDLNVNLSNLQQCNYNTSYLNSSGNIAYNTYPRIPCGNENSNSFQILSTLNDSENFSIYDKEKFNSCSSFQTESDTFHNSKISSLRNQSTFAFHQYTKHRGNYYKNGIDSSKFLYKNYDSLNMRNKESWKLNYNHKRKHFSQSSFRSGSEFSRKFYGNSFQKYKRQESYTLNRNKKYSVSNSKSNFSKSNYYRGNFSHSYEHKSIKNGYREILDHPQEKFFNAAANPSSYT